MPDPEYRVSNTEYPARYPVPKYPNLVIWPDIRWWLATSSVSDPGHFHKDPSHSGSGTCPDPDPTWSKYPDPPGSGSETLQIIGMYGD